MGLANSVRKIISSEIDFKDLEHYGSTAELRRPKKRAKVEELSSVTIGYLNSRKGSQKSRDIKRMKILLDSGCGGTLLNHRLIKN